MKFRLLLIVLCLFRLSSQAQLSAVINDLRDFLGNPPFGLRQAEVSISLIPSGIYQTTTWPFNPVYSTSKIIGIDSSTGNPFSVPRLSTSKKFLHYGAKGNLITTISDNGCRSPYNFRLIFPKAATPGFSNRLLLFNGNESSPQYSYVLNDDLQIENDAQSEVPVATMKSYFVHGYVTSGTAKYYLTMKISLFVIVPPGRPKP